MAKADTARQNINQYWFIYNILHDFTCAYDSVGKIELDAIQTHQIRLRTTTGNETDMPVSRSTVRQYIKC